MLPSRRRNVHKQPMTTSASGTVLVDADVARKAVLEVVQVWLDRLQLISMITTFFSSIDSILLAYTARNVPLGTPDSSEWTKTLKLMNASLAGALIFHVCAAITSFIASFVLVRYKLLDADRHEQTVLSPGRTPAQSEDLEKPALARTASVPVPHDSTGRHASRPHARSQSTSFSHALDFLPDFAHIFSDISGRVAIYRVHLFRTYDQTHRKDPDAEDDGADETSKLLDPPVTLLSRCHTLSVMMSMIGFALALLGILTFAWTSLPKSVSIFMSACLAACLGSSAIALST